MHKYNQNFPISNLKTINSTTKTTTIEITDESNPDNKLPTLAPNPKLFTKINVSTSETNKIPTSGNFLGLPDAIRVIMPIFEKESKKYSTVTITDVISHVFKNEPMFWKNPPSELKPI